MGNEPSAPLGDNVNSPRGLAADRIRQASADMLANSSLFLDDMRSALDIRAQLQKRTFYPLTGKTLPDLIEERQWGHEYPTPCLLYTSDAADEEDSVDLGGRRIL
eukprot:TRINITY_DN21483_c0_g1_i2.p1 TRINITY_DN21483_c0_g1~~TRINITY_DN21483_c0_g1_i2.p1  ORF type:complete len:105 (-),score=28.24 TRINITY_DN21483_c0_g1_i2:77-391(-)